jgi:hypothetical protein
MELDDVRCFSAGPIFWEIFMEEAPEEFEFLRESDYLE